MACDGMLDGVGSEFLQRILSRVSGWCFSFGIRAGASTALIKGIARAAGSSAELITGQDRMQPKETLQFPLQPQDGDRLPVHRLASKSLLLELEGAVEARSEGDRCPALETGLSSGVVCSLTAYVGVDMERGQLGQGPLVQEGAELRVLRSRAGTRGVFPAEAGVSAECRRLMGPGPLAGHRAGGELDRCQGEDAQSGAGPVTESPGRVMGPSQFPLVLSEPKAFLWFLGSGKVSLAQSVRPPLPEGTELLWSPVCGDVSGWQRKPRLGDEGLPSA
ncbi:von Willebrand factor A domain-containing protein 5A [Chelonia mydas]|uniref:von Willebrand factor A domain-containing protein 5A n=1 Tax=Chelonia mydas TaxID=8469 RepID=M7CB22_CHEMY|nr:von Willebrand factor A domain-containing protein 5A [Chelonia mydas]